ncbi:hypothetical protein [Pseudomonas sp. 25 E 4]|nr:hypothetical protein [Pseudomonas sp. 25 E 4]
MPRGSPPNYRPAHRCQSHWPWIAANKAGSLPTACAAIAPGPPSARRRKRTTHPPVAPKHRPAPAPDNARPPRKHVIPCRAHPAESTWNCRHPARSLQPQCRQSARHIPTRTCSRSSARRPQGSGPRWKSRRRKCLRSVGCHPPAPPGPSPATTACPIHRSSNPARARTRRPSAGDKSPGFDESH